MCFGMGHPFDSAKHHATYQCIRLGDGTSRTLVSMNATDQFKIDCYDRVTEIMRRSTELQLKALEERIARESDGPCESSQEGA